MSQPAQKIAERYQLRLSNAWQAWFNSDSENIALPGIFRAPLAIDHLLADAPPEIWPGFMLPDTLPLLSNEYGDWICARVEANGELGELVHWYHGGGDWIPVGRQLAEMVVHDVVDQFRPISRQMLRGAPESIEPGHQARLLAIFADPQLRHWLSVQLTSVSTTTGDTLARPANESLESLAGLLASGDYEQALELLHDQHWAADAVACDLIQFALQRQLSPLADASIAEKLAMNWTPDYVRLLFDICQVPVEVRSQMMAMVAPEMGGWPEQPWHRAEQLAAEVLQRRDDLGWAVNIAGWSKQRAGDLAGAAKIYFAGRYASAFSDQAVRMRTHWIEQQYGKFSLAQLSALGKNLSASQQADQYTRTVLSAPAKLTMQMVREYWLHAARQHLDVNAAAEAYACFYRAGWDLGAQRLSEYQPILEGLVHSAHAADWPARSAVAATHLACLSKRLG